jgi:hypothetical protein
MLSPSFDIAPIHGATSPHHKCTYSGYSPYNPTRSPFSKHLASDAVLPIPTCHIVLAANGAYIPRIPVSHPDTLK